jgi:non-heme chloroperoxidase
LVLRHSVYHLGMERRSALKSMIVALTGTSFFTGGSFTMAAKQPSRVAQRSTTMIETRDGTRIHFRDWGTGRPIFFVAPWIMCSDWWDASVMALSKRGWRCVTFDRRGHGRSEEPSCGYDFDTLSDDIADIMDALDVRNVVLVGHSMGGAEVVRYLTRHNSRRVAHAVLIAPATPFSMKTDDHLSGMTREALNKLIESFNWDFATQVAKAAPDFFGASKNSIPVETMDSWARQLVDRCSLKTTSDLYKTLMETDFRPELRTIQTPTLLLHGDIDKSCPLESTGRPTHELIAGSRLLVYENAAHALPYTHRDRMLEDIVAFAESSAS